jgi:CheY-like chemotaxis protein
MPVTELFVSNPGLAATQLMQHRRRHKSSERVLGANEVRRCRLSTWRILQSSASKEVVLVVDDSPTAQAYVKKVLGDAGYLVLTASGAVDAVPMYGRCDIVLMDYNLRGMQGDKALEFIQKNYPHLVVYLHTAESEEVIKKLRMTLDPTVQIIRKGDPAALLARLKKR